MRLGMRSVPLLLLLNCIACLSAPIRRGEDALAEGRLADALASFDSALVETPNNTRARKGRRVSLSRLMHRSLEGAAKSRTDGDWVTATHSLAEAAALVTQGAEPKTLMQQERTQLARAIAEWLREPLALGRPLEAESRLKTVSTNLERTGLMDVTRAASIEVRAVGARRCAIASSLAKTPWLTTMVAHYCTHFSAAPPSLPPMPERRSTLTFRREGLRSRPQLMSTLTSAPDRALQELGLVGGQRDGRAPGPGTRYQTCTGTRSVMRSRTEYRMETVTQTRPATRHVTRTVYKTRPVMKRFDFSATQVTARHAATLSLALALPGTTEPLVVDVKQEVTVDDLDHDVAFPRANLVPHRAQVLTASEFETRVVEDAARRVSQTLERAWVTAFCASVDTPETAARCIASSNAPAEAWVPLSRFTGERVEDLRLLLTAGR
jgi:hypothetical protein